MVKKQFSLIEMLTVIVVILILITLLIPSIDHLKKSARSIICANQLKQLGTLISTYANDHDGRLPYTNNASYYSNYSNSYQDKKSYGKLYGSWAGHLIPYFDMDLKTWNKGSFYHDKAKTAGGTVFQEETGDIYKPVEVDTDENYYNWTLLHNMFYEGGHGDLKTMICPEAPNTFSSQYLSQGRYIPRVSGIMPTNSGASLYGLPSSYLCNGQLFGKSATNSRRFEDVNKSNFLLLEGCGQGTQNVQSMATNSYTKTFSIINYYGGGINSMVGAWSNTPQNPASPPPNIAFSFMHDDTEEIWHSYRNGFSTANVNRYNQIFSDAAAIKNLDRPEGKAGAVIAKRYPGENWENYETPATKGKFSIARYYGENWLPNYYFGKMNLLIADLSVNKAHISWVYENSRELGEDSK